MNLSSLKNVLFTVLLFVFSFPIFAQNSLNSPYQTLSIFVENLQPNDKYKPYLASQAFPKTIPYSEQLSIQLKQVLDGKGLKIQMSQISRDENYMDTLSNENIYVIFPKELPEVYLEKDDSTNQWLFSKTTIDEIPRLHKSVYPFGIDILINLIPQADHYTFLGLKIWQYIGIIILLLFGFLTHQLTTFIFRKGIDRVIKTRFKQFIPDPKLIFRIARLLSFVFIFWIIIKLLPILQFSVDTAVYIISAFRIMQTVFLVLLALRVIDLLVVYSERITSKTENTMDDQLLPLIKKAMYLIITISGIIYVLDLLQVNVTALIAGISIGGLALALAAQDTVKNLIGSLMIFIDRPFQIGDYIIVGDSNGTVEEVGFRSTRLRTPDHSIISIPNGKISNMVINNLGLRIYRRFRTDITMTYDTSPEQIEAFVNGIKQIIATYPSTRKEGYEVHFSSMSASSLDIMINAYLSVPTWSEELRAKHELLIQIMKLAKTLNIGFAFPSTSVYIENLNKSKTTISDEELEDRLKNFFSA